MFEMWWASVCGCSAVAEPAVPSTFTVAVVPLTVMAGSCLAGVEVATW
jgi:hypothetical protein